MAGKSGYVDIPGSNGITLRISWQETVYTNNSSRVEITSMQVKSAVDKGVSCTLSGYVYVDDVQTIRLANHQVFLSYETGEFTTVTGEMGYQTVSHNKDGSKTTSIAARIKATGGTGWEVNGSKNIELTKVDTASKPSTEEDVLLGNGVYIYTNRIYASFTHSIRYSVFGQSGEIGKDIGGSVRWTPPLDLAAYCAGNLTGVCTITCDTYDNGTYMGTATTQITVKIPYTKPRVIPYTTESNIVCARCDQAGKLDPTGAYLLLKAGRMYDSLLGVNKSRLVFRHKAESADTFCEDIQLLSETDGNEYAEVIANVVPSPEVAYIIQIEVTDDFGGSDVVTVLIPTAFVTAHAAHGGHGITFGGYHDPAKYDWFVCLFDAHFRGDVLIGETGMTLKEYILSVIREGG